jgi:hypothetical protein
MHMARVFTDHYLGFIPVILGLTGLEVARSVTLLVQARHSSITNWWDIALKAGSMVFKRVHAWRAAPRHAGLFSIRFQGRDLNRWNATANTALAVILD